MRTKTLTFALMALALIAASCEKQAAIDEPEYVTVSLTPDMIDIESEEMTKGTATNDIYGINVYYSSDGSNYDNVYAYGLFDNKEDMTISLLTGYYYKFVCSMVKNGKNTLYNSSDVYYYPFQHNGSLFTIKNNEFSTGGTNYFTGLASGSAHLIGGGTPTESNYNEIPGIERFYGESTGYQPVTGGTVDIALKRVVYGVKFIITGMVEGVGNITVSCPGASVTTDRNCETETVVRSFSDLLTCWQNNQISMPVNVQFDMNGLEWVGEDGELAWTNNIVFKRNYLTIITVNVSFPKGKVEFNLEETLLDDNEIDLGIGSNDLIDIIVNPS